MKDHQHFDNYVISGNVLILHKAKMAPQAKFEAGIKINFLGIVILFKAGLFTI